MKAIQACRDVSLFKVPMHVWPVIRIMEGRVGFIHASVVEGVMHKTKQMFMYIAKPGSEEAVAKVPQTINLFDVR